MHLGGLSFYFTCKQNNNIKSLSCRLGQRVNWVRLGDAMRRCYYINADEEEDDGRHPPAHPWDAFCGASNSR